MASSHFYDVEMQKLIRPIRSNLSSSFAIIEILANACNS